MDARVLFQVSDMRLCVSGDEYVYRHWDLDVRLLQIFYRFLNDRQFYSGKVRLVIYIHQVHSPSHLCGNDGVGDNPRTTGFAIAFGSNGHPDFPDAGTKFYPLERVFLQRL